MPAPVIDQLDPWGGVVGAPDVVLRVLGSGFEAGSVIEWNGADEPTTLVSPGEVTTVVMLTAAGGPESATVRVRNADGAKSNVHGFNIAEGVNASATAAAQLVTVAIDPPSTVVWRWGDCTESVSHGASTQHAYSGPLLGQRTVIGRVQGTGQRIVRTPAAVAPAVGATAGTPGAWTPAGSNPPASVANLAAGVPVAVIANPATAWTAGQYVQTHVSGMPGQARWSGTAWVTVSAAAAEAPAEAAGFDPGAHTVAEVVAYAGSHPDELESLIAAEEAGKARVTLLDQLGELRA